MPLSSISTKQGLDSMVNLLHVSQKVISDLKISIDPKWVRFEDYHLTTKSGIHGQGLLSS